MILLRITSEAPVYIVEESGTEEIKAKVKCHVARAESFAKRKAAVLTFQRLDISVSTQVTVAWWRRKSWQLK